VQEDPHLSNQGISKSDLGESESGDGELADTKDSQSKLRNGHHAAGELPDGDDPFGRHWPAIGTILERHVQKRQAEERGLRLVFKSPSVPLILAGVRGTAAGTKDRLLRNVVAAFSAWFHFVPR